MVGQTATLWGIMKPFDASRLLTSVGLLRWMVGADHVLTRASPTSERDLPDGDYKKQFSQYFQSIQQECIDLGLPMSGKAAKRLMDQLSQPTVTHTEIAASSDEFTRRLTDEMESMFFFSIEPSKQGLLSSENLFGDSVAEAFPSAMEDIKNAARCLAFDQWTASVFHAMRVLEIGLNALAAELKVPFDYRNWENIINEIEAAIKRKKGANKVEEQFNSEAALQFRYFKNAWRNHVMHVRAVTYDEERAEAIFGHVKEFMTHLATRLKEDTGS